MLKKLIFFYLIKIKIFNFNNKNLIDFMRKMIMNKKI
jgi:hypothetical protein